MYTKKQAALLLVVCGFSLLGMSQQTVRTAQPSPKAASNTGSTFSWTQATAVAPWSGRYYHATAVFQNRLWVLGGATLVDHPLADVWSSPDGVNWNLATPSAAWPARFGHQVVAFGGKLWLAGGHSTAGDCNDIWCSSDGINWEDALASAPWAARGAFSMGVLGDNIWLTGGYPEANDVWFSLDGLTWALRLEHAPWAAREGLGCCVFQGKIWMTGGDHVQGLSLGYFNDSWCSADGKNWTQAVANAGWHPRSVHVAITFADRLWVIGGGYDDGYGPGSSLIFLNDVWSSADGATWVQMPNPPWAARWGHSGAVVNGKLWILGGWASPGGQSIALNDVWSMTANDATVRIDGSHDGWYQVGGPLSLQAVSTGLSSQVTYQWLKDGQPIPAATTDRYAVDQVALSDAGSYTCQVTDAVNTLTLTAGPVQILVFPAGSLPLGKCGVLVAAIVSCALVVAYLKHTSGKSTRGQQSIKNAFND